MHTRLAGQAAISDTTAPVVGVQVVITTNVETEFDTYGQRDPRSC